MPVISERLETDNAHLLHPLHHPSALQRPKIWVEGHGAVITDAEGHEYIDGLAGLWNVNVGHGRVELAQAAAGQMSTLAYASAYAGSTNYPAIALAEKLSAITYRSINTFFFTSGGAEASESSFKTARYYWKLMVDSAVIDSASAEWRSAIRPGSYFDNVTFESRFYGMTAGMRSKPPCPLVTNLNAGVCRPKPPAA